MSNIAHHKKGFTLIELLVVITIMAVLMSIGLVSFKNAGISARNARRKADIESVRQALVLYRSDIGCYPNTAVYNTMLSTLSTANYLSSPLPHDPKAGATDYTYVASGSCGSGLASGFTLTATLEPSSPITTYQILNP